MSSVGQGSIGVTNKQLAGGVPVAATSYHGFTPLVSGSGNNATAAAAFIAITGGFAWDWMLPFLTIAAAHTAIQEGGTIKIENGSYPSHNYTKSIYLDCDSGVIFNNVRSTTANKFFKVLGKPQINATSAALPTVYTDNGVVAQLDLGLVTGLEGIFIRGRVGQISYLNAESVIISQATFNFTNGALHNGASGHGAVLYATVDYLQMIQSNPNPLEAAELVALYTSGANGQTFFTGKRIIANTPDVANVSGAFFGVITVQFSGRCTVLADYVLNNGTGRCIFIESGSLHLNCIEVRVTGAAIPCGSIADNAQLYITSGCRFVAGAAAAFAIVAGGAGVNADLYIDGTVYSNKALDPLITLKTGTWVVDANIV